METRAGEYRSACPACNASALSPTSICEQPFSICCDCGCVFANPLPEVSWDSASFYLQEDIALETAMAEVEKCKSRIREIQRFKPPGSLLDVGAGVGYLVRAAQDLDWCAAGCDLSPGCNEVGRRLLGVALFDCEYGDLPRLSGIATPDVITANHVLEHLAEPANFAAFAQSALAPGGFLVVEIPNLFSFESLFAGESWHGLRLPIHLAFFTPRSLERLFEPAFRVALIEYSIADFFHEHIESYLRQLTTDAEFIDRYARQFSGTAMVAYLERRAEPAPLTQAGIAGASIGHRAVARAGRAFRRR